MGRIESALLLAVALAALGPAGPAQAKPETESAGPAAAAGLPPSADPKVAHLLEDAQHALQQGNLNLALIDLKNAVKLVPGDGEVRARLGLVLLVGGDAAGAERELRQARADGAADASVVPGLTQAMLQLHQDGELLDAFPDPGAATTAVTADILSARAQALEETGHPAEAARAMDRSLALRRDGAGLLIRARLARRQGALDEARKFGEEAVALDAKNLEARLLLVDLKRQAGDPRAALAEADPLVEAHPDDAMARLIRAAALIDLDQDAKAKQDVDAVLAKQPHHPQALYDSALLRLRSGDARGAWEIAQAIPPETLQSEPETAVAVAGMAIAADKLDSAGALLGTTLSQQPDLVDARLLLAEVRVRQSNSEEALQVLAPIKDSHDPRVVALLAETNLKLKHYDAAIAALDRVDPSTVSDTTLRQRLLMTEFSAGDRDKALMRLRDQFKADPKSTSAGGLLVSGLLQAGRYDEALAVTDQMKAALGASPLPAFYRGKVLAAQGDLHGAAAAFADALAADGGFVPARYYRGDVLLSLGDMDGATAAFREILAGDPKNVPALLKLADIAARRTQDDEVAALLNQAMVAAPADPAPRVALANYQMLRGNLTAAQATVAALLAQSPDSIEAEDLRGQLQLATGQRDQAITTYRGLAARLPDSPEIQMRLSHALIEAGDRAGGEQALQRAIEIDPRSIVARRALWLDLVADGKGDQALAQATAFRTDHPGTDADLLAADVLLALKRDGDAKALLAEALPKASDGRVVIRLAQAEAEGGEGAKALADLSAWLEKHAGDLPVRAERARLLLGTGDRKAARADYEAILARTNDPVALNNLGWLVQKEDPARAMKLVTLAAQLAPRAPGILDTLGWMKFQAGDRAAALELLERAHAASGTDPEISYHLAAALDAAGKRDAARTLVQQALAAKEPFEDRDSARALAARLQ